MKRLTFNKRNDLSQLHDEILAAIPSLQPVNNTPVMRVEGLGDAIALTVPDNADDVAITAIVTAHIPQAPTPPPNIVNVFQAYVAALSAASTPAQIKSVLMNEQIQVFKALAQGIRGKLN